MSDRCPTECDKDCTVSCHEVHEVPQKRAHTPADCPANQEASIIDRAALSLAFGAEDEAKYFIDDARKVHAEVYGPLLAELRAKLDLAERQIALLVDTPVLRHCTCYDPGVVCQAHPTRVIGGSQ